MNYADKIEIELIETSLYGTSITTILAQELRAYDNRIDCSISSSDDNIIKEMYHGYSVFRAKTMTHNDSTFIY